MINGIWKHYKGKRYYVIDVARHTETGEDMVIYVPLYKHEDGGRPLQARPAKMWLEKVEWQGRVVERFVYEGDTLDKKAPGQ